MTPIRIQRKRTNGWKKPEGTINCTRPGKFGNPFKTEKYGKEKALELFSRLFTESTILAFTPMQQRDIIKSEFWQAWRASNYMSTTDMVIKELVGHNLMCFCKITDKCHVDILLKVANS